MAKGDSVCCGVCVPHLSVGEVDCGRRQEESWEIEGEVGRRGMAVQGDCGFVCVCVSCRALHGKDGKSTKVFASQVSVSHPGCPFTSSPCILALTGDGRELPGLPPSLSLLQNTRGSTSALVRCLDRSRAAGRPFTKGHRPRICGTWEKKRCRDKGRLRKPASLEAQHADPQLREDSY